MDSIQVVNKVYRCKLKMLKDKSLSKKTKMKIFRVMYTAETQSITRMEEKQLRCGKGEG